MQSEILARVTRATVTAGLFKCICASNVNFHSAPIFACSEDRGLTISFCHEPWVDITLIAALYQLWKSLTY